MVVTEQVKVQVRVAAGPVPAELPELAREKVGAVLRHVGEPVLAAHVLLAIAPDPAVARPAIAAATVSVNGRLVRAEAAAETMRDAVDELASRLQVQLGRVWQGQPAGRPAVRGRRRHGPTADPETGGRPVIRHASVAAGPESPAAAAAELEQLGYDFHLFTDELTGQDTVIYRTPDGYRVAFARPASSAPAASPESGAERVPESRITVSAHAAPRLSVGEAITRLENLGQPFVFFVDVATGRGAVLHYRLDGSYGLVVPADTVRQLRM
jgi:ribosome-associated translation inhibitor RaiA